MLLNWALALPAGAGAIRWFDVPAALTACTDGTCALLVRATNKHGVAVAENFQSTVAPHRLRLPPARLSFAVSDPGSLPAQNVSLSVRGSAAAIYVALTASARGYFTPNWFGLAMGEEKVVAFIPFSGGVTAATLELLHTTTRIEHLGQHIPDTPQLPFFSV